MPYASAGKNLMLDALNAVNPTTAITHASLHDGIPSDSGSNELSGGTPAYARKLVDFDAASGGAMDKDATDPVFDVPASTTVLYVGYFSALTAGTFLGFSPINGGSVKGEGTAKDTGDVITSHGHGLVNTDRILLEAVAGESLPAGLDGTTLYFVVGATTDTFQVSLTSGGAAVAITADGELRFQKTIPEVFGSQGTLTLDTATLDLNG